tara:strand:+ start:399 stop:701 length:303 start_codon:yes stop_codon:yes gene_type:complete
MSDKLLDIAVFHQKHMNQPLVELAEYYPDDFKKMCATVNDTHNYRVEVMQFKEYLDQLVEFYANEDKRMAKITGKGTYHNYLGTQLLEHLIKELNEKMGL